MIVEITESVKRAMTEDGLREIQFFTGLFKAFTIERWKFYGASLRSYRLDGIELDGFEEASIGQYSMGRHREEAIDTAFGNAI